MDRLDIKVHDYLTKFCSTYDPKSRCIDGSELQRLCSDFNLNYRDCKDYIKHDSQGRVPYSEIARLIRDCNPYHNGVQSPSNVHSHDFSPIYPSYTNDSFTPEYPPEDDYLGHPRDPHISPPDQEHDPNLRSKSSDPSHWHHHDRVSPAAVPGSAGGVSNQWHQNDSSELLYKGRPVYCGSCKYLQRQLHELERDLMAVKRERDKLHKEYQEHYQKTWHKQAKDYEGHLALAKQEKLELQLYTEKLQRDLHQSSQYYQKAIRDKDKMSKELKRIKESGTDSDGGRSHFDRHYDDLKRTKEELEIDLKQYKKHYIATKQENEQLKQQFQDLQREKWALKDDNHRLHCQMIREDPLLRPDGRQPSRAHSSGAQLPTISRTFSAEQDIDKPVREISKPKSMKSAPSEASDVIYMSLGSSTTNESAQVLILNEDVSISVLPENLSQEQKQQMICALQNCHSIQELIRCLVSYGLTAPDEKSQGTLVENEHLKSRVKHLEAKYHTLAGSFEIAKQDTEAMYQKLAKVEGNNCRLRHIVKLCQQACEVHELLYEMKMSPATDGFSPICDSEFSSRNTEHGLGGKNVLTRARSLLHHLESNKDLHNYLPPASTDGKSSLTSWNFSMSQYTGTTSGLSSSASSVGGGELELNSTEVEQLKVYYQGLVWYASHLVRTLSEVDGLKDLDTVREPKVTKDSSSTTDYSKMGDMEECADAEELCKIREEKAELRSQIYMMEQSKRSMELQVSRIQLHSSMLEKANIDLQFLYKSEKDKRRKLRDKLKAYKTENHIPESSMELQIASDREKEALHRFEELYLFMQRHIQDSQNMSEQLVDFVKELLRANRALVEAFERAKKRQQFEKRQLKQEIIQLNNRLHSSGQHHVPPL